MNVNRAIFRPYDIRGVFGDSLTLEVAEHIGKAFGTILKRRLNKENITIVVGRDSRESSPDLSQSFISGLLSTGCDVVYIGLSMTPVVHFLTTLPEFDAGVEVTASHNPKEFNGFRLDYSDAHSVPEADIQHLRELIEAEDYEKGEGKLEEQDLFYKYLDNLKNRFNFSTSYKISINCGYATMSHFATKIFTTLGQNLSLTACQIDPSFPAGVPDPESFEFMQSVKQNVIDSEADVGFAFDTDCDRFGVVDENGENYTNDKSLIVFSEHLLKGNPGETVLCDIKSSYVVSQSVESFGGVSKRIRTGHTFFVEQMKAGALLGGEYSGHMYFRENHGYDDGIYAACMMLEIMEKTGKKVSELYKDIFKTCHTDEIKIPIPDEKKYEVVEEIKRLVFENDDVFKKIITVDGVRAYTTDSGWFLVRASNTSPELSVRIEGTNEAEVLELKAGVVELLKTFGIQNLEKITNSLVHCR